MALATTLKLLLAATGSAEDPAAHWPARGFSPAWTATAWLSVSPSWLHCDAPFGPFHGHDIEGGEPRAFSTLSQD